MNLRFLLFPALLSAVLCAAPCAQAQTRVGEAVLVQNEVVRVWASAQGAAHSAADSSAGKSRKRKFIS